MNPAILVLSLASLLPLAFRRGEIARAWALLGLAGLILLAPALLVPDGFPSPSATLGQLAPWQGQVTANPGNPNLVDVTFQVEPWLLFLRGEIRQGRMPFWNPHQSSGAPYWSNGSSAPLFPLHLVFAMLPFQLGFVVLPWLRVVIGGLGTYRLARELGVGPGGGLLAALLYALCGRMVSFLLFPMANALCLAPWIFLFSERLATSVDGAAPERAAPAPGADPRPRRAWRWLAVLAGLQLLAGHPETPVFTAMASGLFLLVRLPFPPVSSRPWRPYLSLWRRVFGAWIVGALLAGIAIVPLALTLFETSRWQEWDPGSANSIPLILSLLLRFVLPDAFGHAVAGQGGAYWGPLPFTPTTVYLGALALPLAAAGLARVRRRQHRQHRVWRAMLVTLLACLAASYHFPGARELLLALPVIQKGLHHYLLFAVALGVALFAGAGLDAWLTARRRTGDSRGLLLGVLSLGLALGAGWITFAADWKARGQVASQAGWTAWVLGLGLLLLAGLLLSPAWRRRLLPLVLLVTVADLAFTNGRSNPALSASDLYPRTGAVQFLAAKPERVAALGHALRPNAAMVYGLYDIRGDDSLKLLRYEAMYQSQLGEGHPTFFQPITRWQSPWLDRLGVRWVLAPPASQPPVASWSRAYEGADAVVFERPGWQPLARFEDGGGSVEIVERQPGRWRLRWTASNPGRIVIASTWDQGWRARRRAASEVAGDTAGWTKAPIQLVDGVLMGIDVAAGSGEIELRHRPAGLGWGLGASLSGLVLLFLAGRAPRRSRPRLRPGAVETTRAEG